jgi:hypothetical protein
MSFVLQSAGSGRRSPNAGATSNLPLRTGVFVRPEFREEPQTGAWSLAGQTAASLKEIAAGARVHLW